MSTVEIELGDDLYEVEVTSFDVGRPASRRGHIDSWSPAEGGEIEIGEEVTWHSGTGPKRCPLDSLLDQYADYHGIRKLTDQNTRDAARARLYAECFEDLIRQMEDAYDDR